MWDFVRSIIASRQFTESLVDRPFLMLFMIPWIAAALIALLYIQTNIVLAVKMIDSMVQLVLIGVGFVMTCPWLILALKATHSMVVATKVIYRKSNGVSGCVRDVQKFLKQWSPRNSKDAIRILAMVIIWSIASFPFSVLIVQLFMDSRITLALFLGLILIPYWALAISGIAIVVHWSFAQHPTDLHEQIELVTRN